MSQRARGKKGKKGKRPKQKSTPRGARSPRPASDEVQDAAKLAREFALWAAGEGDKVLVEVRKSELATQLRDMGVARGTAILNGAMKALAAEQEQQQLAKILAEVEEQAKAEAAQREAPAVQAEAERILRSPDILAEMLATTDRLGHVGEEAVRLLVFLSAVAGLTARTHDDAIHLILKGPSSGGKNAVVKRVLELLPKGAALVLSNSTQLGLVYVGRSFPVLVFQEVEGVKGAEYLVRQIMSEGVVTRIRADGIVRTAFKTSVITTTTRARIHPENETRAFSASVSPDPDLTRRVIEAEAATAAGVPRPEMDGDLLLGWREALARLEGGEVVIPFAAELARAFPHEQVRARRDFQRVLNLVRACALLHQATRERDSRGRIVAERRDHELVEPVLGTVLGEVDAPLTAQGEQVLALLGELASRSADGWVERVKLVREAEAAGIATRPTVRTWCRRFKEEGLCDVRPSGGRLLYRLRDGRAAQ